MTLPHLKNNPPLYDYLIVGAGLYGSVFAHLATLRGARCLIIDKRNNPGGSIRCEKIEGIQVHAFGPHIFHTSSDAVWKFVNSLVPFNRFTNSPLAMAPDGKIYNLPFNMNTFSQLWGVTNPEEARAIIDAQRQEAIEDMRKRGIDSPTNLEEQALALAGRDIYNLLIKGYSEKQWGRDCRRLPAFIIRRLPLRFTFDNNYFSDSYQGIPCGGYNPLIDKLLEGSEVITGIDYNTHRGELRPLARTLVYTGPIDEYFDYCFGHLDYRTLRFETEILDTPNFQGNAVVNFTDRNVPFTRRIEHKHFDAFGDKVYDNPVTVITHEYPSEWKAGMDPYYPVNDDRNRLLYQRYRELADHEADTIFGGRLAEYRYYDMAPIVEALLKRFEMI